ncbi:hypothetical protein E8F20_10750 [Pseudomonas sp. BN415]|uniref:hypothetical protein n=1 Tax=Pseudomonas sp. BN415 TaxID=2567889 RepID=UPI002455007A|nr:hypothetical protein [Pseudomonas sp. BN415]MDH4582349.1 hypothetical protein [Pseudomonas sp. BN415]
MNFRNLAAVAGILLNTIRETDKSVVFEILDSQMRKIDVTLETEKLSELSNEVDLVTNSFTNIGHSGELNYGYAISRQLSHASSSDESSVKLVLSDGSSSRRRVQEVCFQREALGAEVPC